MGKTIIASMGMLAALGVFIFYTKPEYDKAQAVSAQIADYDVALAKATELQTLKESLLKKFNEFSTEDKDRLQKLLPDHVDNVRLILDLDNIASRRGMVLQNVTVSTPGVSDSTQTAIGAIGASRQKYDTLTTKFSTQGTYRSFLDLLMDFETSLRIMDLVDLSMSVGGSSLARGSEPVYSYEVTLRTYWLK